MNEQQARIIVAEYCRKLYHRGYVPGMDGNVSMRVGKDTAVVTPAALSKELVTPDDLVCMTLSGDVLTGARKPSSETPMHMAVYMHRPEVGAVIHTHSPYAASFALANKPIDTRRAPFAYYHIGIIGNVPYSAPGSAEFHENVAAAVKEGHKVLMLENHGVMALGTDMADAFAKQDLTEAYAKMLVHAEVLGGARVLSDKQLEEITHG